MWVSAATIPCSRWSTVGSSFVPKPRAACSYRYFRQRRPRPSKYGGSSESAGIQSNRRAQMGFEKGETGCRLPLSISLQEPVMTLLEGIVDQTRREYALPVLETERLLLRAPRCGDVKAIAALANDRRIAANTARIPHPYSVAD